MAELTIFDSRGQRLDADDERRGGDQRIKDLFFDGLRFSIDTLQREVICFFRARDDQASRSEQYYAVYDYANNEELSDLPRKVERVVEDDEGMILDSSQDDTRVFDLLRSDRSPELQYVDMDFRYDIEELLSTGKPIRLGVPSYEDAYATFSDWLTPDADRFAIAENATSSNLDTYDVVVDPTGHSEMTALGQTERALESLRERRRTQNAANGATQEEYTTRRKAGLAAGVGLLGIGIVLFALIGACTVAPGPADAIPGSPCSALTGGGSSGANVTITDVDRNDASLTVNGTVTGAATNTSHNATFSVQRQDGSVENVRKDVTVAPAFATNVTFDRSVSNATNLTVSVAGANDTYAFDGADTGTDANATEATATETNSTATDANATETTETDAAPENATESTTTSSNATAAAFDGSESALVSRLPFVLTNAPLA